MCRYYRYSCMFSKRFRILQIHLSACITKIKHFAILVFTFLISSMSVLTPPPTRNCLLLCLFLFLLLLYKNQHSCGDESAINSAVWRNTQYDHHLQLFILSIRENVEKLPYFHSINFWILQNGTKWSLKVIIGSIVICRKLEIGRVRFAMEDKREYARWQ